MKKIGVKSRRGTPETESATKIESRSREKKELQLKDIDYFFLLLHLYLAWIWAAYGLILILTPILIIRLTMLLWEVLLAEGSVQQVTRE